MVSVNCVILSFRVKPCTINSALCGALYSMSVEQIFIGGRWQASENGTTFQAYNPRTGESLQQRYPISSWSDCDRALDQAIKALEQLRQLPDHARAEVLEKYASRIEARKNDLVEMAHLETALPKSPRLADAELPRTVDQ